MFLEVKLHAKQQLLSASEWNNSISDYSRFFSFFLFFLFEISIDAIIQISHRTVFWVGVDYCSTKKEQLKPKSINSGKVFTKEIMDILSPQ